LSIGAPAAWGLAHASDAYRGRVVDAETKQPLVGAVVLAIWYRAIPVAPHGPAEDFYDAFEVLTDMRGEFPVPAKVHVTLIGTIEGPTFVIYQPGYGYYPVFQIRPTGDAIENAFQEFTVVELPRWRTREQRRQLMDLPVWTTKVPAAKMPNLIHRANEEGQSIGISSVYGREKLR